MNPTVRKAKSNVKSKSRSSDCPKPRNNSNRKGERPRTKKCSLLPAHAFSPNANQSRITQKKGLYAFGKTSLRVSRDIYFNQTEETEARANEDLHKIINLANCDHKSAKHAEHHVKEEVPIMSKTANRNHSREEVSSNSRSYSERKSKSSVRSDTSSNSNKKTKRPCSRYESHSPVTNSDGLNPSNMQADEFSPMIVQTSSWVSPDNHPWELPSDVLEDTTNDLLTTFGIKLRDLRRNKDGTCGDQYYRQIRHNLQRIHRQRFKSNIISKLVPNESLYEAPSNHAVQSKDAIGDGVAHVQQPIRLPESMPLCKSDDFRVKIPITFSRPFSIAFSEHPKLEDDFPSVADFTTYCDHNNSSRTNPFMISNSPKVKHRKFYAPGQMQPMFGQSLQDSVGLDILDYADTPVHSNSFPVQQIQSNNDNEIWRSLPVISPIKLSPFSNPSPRFYRRKLF